MAGRQNLFSKERLKTPEKHKISIPNLEAGSFSSSSLNYPRLSSPIQKKPTLSMPLQIQIQSSAPVKASSFPQALTPSKTNEISFRQQNQYKNLITPQILAFQEQKHPQASQNQEINEPKQLGMNYLQNNYSYSQSSTLKLSPPDKTLSKEEMKALYEQEKQKNSNMMAQLIAESSDTILKEIDQVNNNNTPETQQYPFQPILPKSDILQNNLPIQKTNSFNSSNSLTTSATTTTATSTLKSSLDNARELLKGNQSARKNSKPSSVSMNIFQESSQKNKEEELDLIGNNTSIESLSTKNIQQQCPKSPTHRFVSFRSGRSFELSSPTKNKNHNKSRSPILKVSVQKQVKEEKEKKEFSTKQGKDEDQIAIKQAILDASQNGRNKQISFSQDIFDLELSARASKALSQGNQSFKQYEQQMQLKGQHEEQSKLLSEDFVTCQHTTESNEPDELTNLIQIIQHEKQTVQNKISELIKQVKTLKRQYNQNNYDVISQNSVQSGKHIDGNDQDISVSNSKQSYDLEITKTSQFEEVDSRLKQIKGKDELIKVQKIIIQKLCHLLQ